LYYDSLGFLLTGKQREDSDKVASVMEQLCRQMIRQAQNSSPVNAAHLPTKVYGDIHGQFRDLLLLLHHYGFPFDGGPEFVFNGDFVDRGAHQIEVLALIYALKVVFPDQVHLNRGNHEDEAINEHMEEHGLWHHVNRKWGEERGGEVFDLILETYAWLPFATIVCQKILVVHGGIGDGKWDIDYLYNVPRPTTSEMICNDHVLNNILWSDPIDEDQRSSFGVHSSPRDGHAGALLRFGPDVSESFLARHGFDMLIRSHQSYTNEGVDVMHNSKLLRVFSARDYEGGTNDSGILLIEPDTARKQIIVRPQLLYSINKPREEHGASICRDRPDFKSMQRQLSALGVE